MGRLSDDARASVRIGGSGHRAPRHGGVRQLSPSLRFAGRLDALLAAALLLRVETRPGRHVPVAGRLFRFRHGGRRDHGRTHFNLAAAPATLRQELIAGTFERCSFRRLAGSRERYRCSSFPSLTRWCTGSSHCCSRAVFGLPDRMALGRPRFPVALLGVLAFLPFGILIAARRRGPQAGDRSEQFPDGRHLGRGWSLLPRRAAAWVDRMGIGGAAVHAGGGPAPQPAGRHPSTGSAWTEVAKLTIFAAVLIPLSSGCSLGTPARSPSSDDHGVLGSGRACAARPGHRRGRVRLSRTGYRGVTFGLGSRARFGARPMDGRGMPRQPGRRWCGSAACSQAAARKRVEARCRRSRG